MCQHSRGIYKARFRGKQIRDIWRYYHSNILKNRFQQLEIRFWLIKRCVAFPHLARISSFRIFETSRMKNKKIAVKGFDNVFIISTLWPSLMVFPDAGWLEIIFFVIILSPQDSDSLQARSLFFFFFSDGITGTVLTLFRRSIPGREGMRTTSDDAKVAQSSWRNEIRKRDNLEFSTEGLYSS